MIRPTLLCLALLTLLPAAPVFAADGPQQKACIDRYAQESGRLAFLEAKLGLADRQRPAWVRWSQWVLQGAQQQRDACLGALAEHPRQSALDRDLYKEKELQIRLQTLQAARPALQDLYAALNAEQKLVMDEGAHDFDGRPRKN
jgi:hypothetical protein